MYTCTNTHLHMKSFDLQQGGCKAEDVGVRHDGTGKFILFRFFVLDMLHSSRHKNDSVYKAVKRANSDMIAAGFFI